MLPGPRCVSASSLRPMPTWLAYVVQNRSGRHPHDDDADLVVGPVADDRVYDVVEAYELGQYTDAEAIRRLESFKLTDQVVFKTTAALAHLAFVESHRIEGTG